LFAATSIAIAAVQRFLHPQPLEQIGVGVAISVIASVINLAVARRLLVAGKRYRSIALEADARHLMTDVWTSVGVILGIGAVGITGWVWLDPIIALAVALNIILSGISLVRRSVLGLIDTALPDAEVQQIRVTLDSYQQREGLQWHALRTRQAGVRRFMSVHVLVPGHWTVQEGHRLLEQIEHDLREALPSLTIVTHLEPLGDASAYADTELVREEAAQPEH
jgi:cation diffusion facilitator family transporter